MSNMFIIFFMFSNRNIYDKFKKTKNFNFHEMTSITTEVFSERQHDHNGETK